MRALVFFNLFMLAVAALFATMVNAAAMEKDGRIADLEALVRAYKVAVNNCGGA